MATRGVFDDAFYNPIHVLPTVQFTSIAAGNSTLTAAQVSGAQETVLASSGATSLTLPTAAQLFLALQNLVPNFGGVLGVGGTGSSIVGLSYKLRVINTNAGTLTIVTGTGITLTGTATIVTQAFRDFLVTITSPTTATVTSIGSATTTTQ